ncbi:hypothetical protein GH714_023420 [Hevea brasiliensis]|uniref:C2 domain-containing protein n=1 Tax=Hevea brasiliensis TaxID=3981 RepID=A0A6A6LU56_HEVBR|nr:hypothetical protein GH714_023420 [Hevea brasiliensis]
MWAGRKVDSFIGIWSCGITIDGSLPAFKFGEPGSGSLEVSVLVHFIGVIMDSPQSVVSPFKSSVVAEPEKQKSHFAVQTSDSLSKGIEAQRKEAMVDNLDFIGILDVYIHQARDIHNICIYHKQDVYAKFCLTSDPENTVSTKIINGGGRNPVFNDDLRFNVKTIDSSLKCEIFMMSRVRNYLEDQLLGFALMMVSEYFRIPCTSVDSESSDSLVTSDVENHVSSEMGVHVMESFLAAAVDSNKVLKPDSPPSSVSTNGVSSPSVAASSDTSDAPASKPPNQEHDSARKEKKGGDVGDGETDSSGGAQSEKTVKPVITVNIEPEQNVVQQDIVDMYMKSMQQFTESLAKMKLPLDIDSGPTSSGSSTSDQKMQSSKNSGSRVFYGSRAFF